MFTGVSVLRVLTGAGMIFCLAGCGGGSGGSVALPTPSPTPGPVTFTLSGGFSNPPADESYVIHSDGSVTRTNHGQTAAAQLSIVKTAQLYADVRNAWPLSALPQSSYPDFPALTVSWQGETSPDISQGGHALEDALLADYGNVGAAFPTPAPTP